MTIEPRSIATLLDAHSAEVRAAQVAALADPVRLRVLSAIAAGSASAPDIPDAQFADAAAQLVAAGLLSVTAAGSHELTADAWVRFGRLLSPAPVLGGAAPDDTPAAPAAEVPEVIARVAAELGVRYAAHFSAETVSRYVTDSYRLLVERAATDHLLPSLTTQFATDRLSALATARELKVSGTPEVLFVCVQNAGRSQLAAAILRYLAGDAVHVRTAGSAPAAAISPLVVEVLNELGIPLAAEYPKPLTDEVVRAADYVITMGCGDACPIYPGRRYLDWVIEDPAGMTIAGVRLVRDDIYARVRALLDDMRVGARGVRPAASGPA